MRNHLYEFLQKILIRRWGIRVPGILDDADSPEIQEMSSSDAYAFGYQAGYFEAVADLVAEGVIVEPVGTPPLNISWQGLVSEDIH